MDVSLRWTFPASAERGEAVVRAGELLDLVSDGDAHIALSDDQTVRGAADL